MVVGWFEKHYKLSSLITVFGAVAIFYMSSLTFEGVSYTTNINSILYHFFAFFFFASFLYISSLKGKKKYPILILALIISLLYAILDEFHQFFVPGRNSSIVDFFIDSLGIMLASMIYAIRIEFVNRKIKE